MSLPPNDVGLSGSKLTPSQRVVSLDALRGFDMLWIIGLDEIIPHLAPLISAADHPKIAGPLNFAATQLTHAKWEGLNFEDLIFPLFIFIVGVSLVFSLAKALSQKSRGVVVTRIISRACILYLLGLMHDHGFDQPMHAFAGQTHAHHAIRWFGVLQRIAICYGAAATLYCFVSLRYLAFTTATILIGYWLLVAYVPVPGVGRGSFAQGRNLPNYLDEKYLGGYRYEGTWDPEGYLSNLPAVASCLLGVFAGKLLKDGKSNSYSKVGILLLGGAALAAVGYAWGFLPSPLQFPVIKKIWTSSFVLIAGGYSAMILGLFYLVIDVWKLRGWSMPFIWVGTNAITLYMVNELGFIRTTAQCLAGGGNYKIEMFGPYQTLTTMLTGLCLTLALARFLYRRGVFVRV